MLYLLFYEHGTLRKLLLDKPVLTLGREIDNDFVLEDEFISRHHIRIEPEEERAIVTDLGSRNGMSVDNRRVLKTILGLNQYFTIGSFEFVLKKGTPEDLTVSRDLAPFFDKLGRMRGSRRLNSAKTKYIKNLFKDVLLHLADVGLKKPSLESFLFELTASLASLPEFGSLYLVLPGTPPEYQILLSINEIETASACLDRLNSDRDLFSRTFRTIPVPEKDMYLQTCSLMIGSSQASLVYASLPGEEVHPKRTRFLKSLTNEIDLIAKVNPDYSLKIVDRIPEAKTGREIITRNKRMIQLVKEAERLGRSDLFILIRGESGTGKELFARLIHNHSPRKNAPFVALNCAAIPEDLLESELFGSEKGAFTGAHAQRKGKLEVVSGGTLILDEIGDMPLNVQAKLLRAIQEQEFYRLGGSVPIRVDLRIISLSNQDLKELLKVKGFREDLYYRLVHRQISIPPLRERPEDITTLINYFTILYSQRLKRRISGYSIRALRILQDYSWPGNVRQLENEIKSLVNLCEEGAMIDHELLSEDIQASDKLRSARISPAFPKRSREAEKEWLEQMLKKNGGNKTRTAEDIGLTYRGLQLKLLRLGIAKPRPKRKA